MQILEQIRELLEAQKKICIDANKPICFPVLRHLEKSDGYYIQNVCSVCDRRDIEHLVIKVERRQRRWHKD